MIKRLEIQTGKKFIAYAPAMTWSDRLNAAMKERGWNKAELARRSGLSYDSVNKYLRGNIDQPRGDAMERLAKAVGKDLLWLRDGIDPGTAPAKVPGLVGIPDLAIFGGLGGGGLVEVMADEAGMPLDADQLRGYWTFPEYMMAGFRNLRRIYAWEVRGDSMEPTLAGGSVVFVDMSQDRLPPDDIYAIDYGDGLMVKRLKLVPRSDRVSVISDNERYGVDELMRDEVHVYGRVVGWFQWRK